jgi:acetylornithine deacetylase/succinyl-diaminopimelate desuccinylase-like protein
VSKLASGDPVVTPLEGPFVQKMTQICRMFSGQEPQIIPLVGGTLPLLGAMKNNVGVLGIGASGNPAYYGSGAHAPNEHIRVSDVPRAIEFNMFTYTQLGEAQA